MSNIESRVIKVITWCMGMPDDAVKPDMTVEELGIDSLDIVEVTLAIDEEFSIDISDEEQGSMRTVQNMIDLVAKKLSA